MESMSRESHLLRQLQSSPTLPLCADLTSNSVGQALHEEPLGLGSGQCLRGPLAAAGSVVEGCRPGAAVRVEEGLLLLLLRLCCALLRCACCGLPLRLLRGGRYGGGAKEGCQCGQHRRCVPASFPLWRQR